MKTINNYHLPYLRHSIFAGILLGLSCLALTSQVHAGEGYPPGDGDCLVSNGTPGCDIPQCQADVCGIDSWCCEVVWDGICANEALDFPSCLPTPADSCTIPPAYNVLPCSSPFEDISGTGIHSALSNQDDAGEMVGLGFPFSFFGDTKNAVGISTNGYLSFGPDLTDFSNDPIPNVNNPNDLIAPLWDDWNPANTGDIYYIGNASDFTAQWNMVVPFGGSPTLSTFQAKLEAGTNAIEFRYNGWYYNSPTVGIENADGTIGINIDPATVGQTECIRFEPIVVVTIDVKPGSNPNCNNTRGGVIPVAVLGSETFDVSTIDPDTVQFGGADKKRCSIDDVNEDGYPDLICHFTKSDVYWPDFSADPSGCVQMNVTGELSSDGTPLIGTDWVCEAGRAYCESETPTFECVP